MLLRLQVYFSSLEQNNVQRKQKILVTEVGTRQNCKWSPKTFSFFTSNSNTKRNLVVSNKNVVLMVESTHALSQDENLLTLFIKTEKEVEKRVISFEINRLFFQSKKFYRCRAFVYRCSIKLFDHQFLGYRKQNTILLKQRTTLKRHSRQRDNEINK